MTIYFTGDTHNAIDIGKLSYKSNPAVRNITENDFLIIAGDFGLVWNWQLKGKEDIYWLNWLNKKPWTTIAVLGNHENWDAYENMPSVEKFGGKLKQVVYNGVVYDKIFAVDEITTLDIEGEHILCIPGAESHDIETLLDPNDKFFKKKKRDCDKAHKFYRVIGRSWWPQEKINVCQCLDFMEIHGSEHFDVIVSHEAPGLVNKLFYGGRYMSNPGQQLLEHFRQTLDFDAWLHGHHHFDEQWPAGKYDYKNGKMITGDVRVQGIYDSIVSLI